MGSHFQTAQQTSHLVVTPPDITTMKVAALLVLVIIRLAHSSPAAILDPELEISGSRIDNNSESGDTSDTSASSGLSSYYTSDPCTDNNCEQSDPPPSKMDPGDRENRDMCGDIGGRTMIGRLLEVGMPFHIFLYFYILIIFGCLVVCGMCSEAQGCGLKAKMMEKL